MKDKNLRYKNIEAYIAGNLEGEELAAFESKLKLDPTLADELVLHQEIQSHLQDKEYAKFEQKVVVIAENYKLEKRKENAKENRIHAIPIRRIAAAVILLIGLAILFNICTQQKTSPTALFAEQYTVPELLTVNRDLSTNSNLSNAYRAYESKNFLEAKKNFQAQSQIKDLPIPDQFYWAISHISANPTNTEEAINLFKKIIDHGNNAYLDPARWYLALAYLQESNPSQSKSLLQELINSGKPKYKAASEKLLQKL